MAFKLPFSKKAAHEQSSEATIMDTSQEASRPMASKTSSSKGSVIERMRPLVVFFVLMAIATAALIIYEGRQTKNTTSHVAAAGEMRMLSQQIAKSALLALQGNSPAFEELRTGTARFASLLSALDQGGEINSTNVPAVSEDSGRASLQALIDEWQKTKANADNLLGQKDNLLLLNNSVDTITKNNAILLDLTEQIAALKLQSGASTADINIINRAALLTQRMAKNASTLRIADAIDPEVAFSLGKDSNAFNEHITQMAKMPNDPEVHKRLSQMTKPVDETLTAVSAILDNVQPLVKAKQAGSRIFIDAVPLLAQTSDLANALNTSAHGFNLISALIALSALLGLGSLGLMAKIYNTDLSDRRREADSQRQNAENERNLTQQAILRLMNEMGDLADGDLTIRATVTEDITGAIADSVNYTIEELSVLVRRINDAATRVTAATQSAQKTSNELLDATERQTREITEAGSTVQRMAQSMIESSERALQSAQVARRSLESARKGAGAVENTIKGMNEIREKIQETSKRIKRLGESSQEIGEIVELISDITEQTNVLALNAAIQAASAGDAGRGFTVVAEEVQRLAERSGEATKQIAAIVKTIQTDTQDAVGAMENATRDVVEGAQLSDAAGQALSEIGQVSTETARLIERISADTQAQASTATQVAESMKGILAITEQTTLGTQQTAVSIGQLADLAVELKGSVSGFKV